MSKYKVIIHYSDGFSEEDNEIFDTQAQAEEHGLYVCSCCSEGAEILNLSDPWEYPLEDAVSADYEVIEIDD